MHSGFHTFNIDCSSCDRSGGDGTGADPPGITRAAGPIPVRTLLVTVPWTGET